MDFNPFRLWRAHAHFQADVREEMNFLIERHGPSARDAALKALADPKLPERQARLLKTAAERLKS